MVSYKARPGYPERVMTVESIARQARLAANRARRARERVMNPELAEKRKIEIRRFVECERKRFELESRTTYKYMTRPTETTFVSLEEQRTLTLEGSIDCFERVNHALVAKVKAAGGYLRIRKNTSRANVKNEIVEPINLLNLPLEIVLDAKFKTFYEESKTNGDMQYVDVYVRYTGV